MPLVNREMQIIKTTLTPQPEWLYQESKRHHQSGKQEGNLHSPVSPPNPALPQATCFSLPFFSGLIPRGLSRACRHALLPLLMWTPHPTPILAHFHSRKWQCPIHGNTFCPKTTETHLAKLSMYALQDSPQPPHSPKNQTGQKKPRNGTLTQQRQDQTSAPRITVIPNPDTCMPV